MRGERLGGVHALPSSKLPRNRLASRRGLPPRGARLHASTLERGVEEPEGGAPAPPRRSPPPAAPRTAWWPPPPPRPASAAPPPRTAGRSTEARAPARPRTNRRAARSPPAPSESSRGGQHVGEHVARDRHPGCGEPLPPRGPDVVAPALEPGRPSPRQRPQEDARPDRDDRRRRAARGGDGRAPPPTARAGARG